MSKLSFILFCLLCWSLPLHALDPEQIMREVRDRDEGEDRRFELVLTQVLPDGFVRERKLLLMEKDYGPERKTTLYFTAPSDTAGTGILMFSYDEATGKGDDQWLYLPALRQSRRIATNSKEGPFLGTDFSFADIERMRVSDYQYRLEGESEIGGRPVYVIRAFTADGLENPRTGYSKRIVHVDQERNLILKDEFYREGRHTKTFSVEEVDQIDGYWTVIRAVMRNHVEGGETRLTTNGVRYNTGLADRYFTQRALRSGIR